MERERIRYQNALDTNAQQRRVIADLHATQDQHEGELASVHDHYRLAIDGLHAAQAAQSQHVCELESDKCELEERLQLMCLSLESTELNADMRVRAMENLNMCLDKELRALGAINDANVEQLRALQLERDASSADTDALLQERDALASRCAQLEAEKSELVASCQKLKDDIARLTIRAAENEVLRAQIKLLNDRSALQVDEFERERQRDQRVIQTLRAETQARIEAHQTQVRIHEENAEKQRQAHERQIARLTEEANRQQDVVEQKALAWELKWMKTVMQQHQPATKTDVNNNEKDNKDNVNKEEDDDKN